MERGLLDRPAPRRDTPVTSPVPLRLLDHALDRDLAHACALVGAATGAGTQVILETTAGAHPVDLFWAACDARAAQLCDRYGVELWLVEEQGQIRIRIERYQADDAVVAARTGRAGWWRRLRRRD
jgi:hypothetical protein